MAGDNHKFVNQPFNNGGFNSRSCFGLGIGPVSFERTTNVISSSPSPVQNQQMLNPVENYLLVQQQQQLVPQFHQGNHEKQNSSFWHGLHQQVMPSNRQYQQNHNIFMQNSQSETAQINLLQQREAMLMQQLPQTITTQNPAPGSANSGAIYVPGTCAKHLANFMHKQQNRPGDNNLTFWKMLVGEFFAPHAKMRLCFSVYTNTLQSIGSFNQGMTNCQICKQMPGYGYEILAEVLPRVFKLKYDTGIMRELLYLDMPSEYQKTSGEIVVNYDKAVEETVYDDLRVVRDGHLRIVFTQDLKISLWEFCAQSVEHFVSHKSIVSQVKQIGNVTQKYVVASENASANNTASEELTHHFNELVGTLSDFAKDLAEPVVNDVGYQPPLVRLLESTQVFNQMERLVNQTSPKMNLTTVYGSPNQLEQPPSQQGIGNQQPQPFAQPGQASYHNSTPRVSFSLSSANGVPNMNNMSPNYLAGSYAYSPSYQIPSVGLSATPPPAASFMTPPQGAAVVGTNGSNFRHVGNFIVGSSSNHFGIGGGTNGGNF